MSLTDDERSKCQEAFRAFDKDSSGYIDRFELRVVLEAMGQKPSEEDLFRMISEVDEHNTGQIQFEEFVKVIEKQKAQQSMNDEADMIDAYVAMGGNADKTGHVDAERLIKVIKEEFQMTINIEELIKEIDTDGSGEIEYDEFKELLSAS
eukprot:CAMPEP_0114998788 /NCGR_PEP_ID=MMETSP0216-20121206/15736_1 /TAXON_ID=223996 /ORGANISM="Protocruzia adherens, Strain Boccale" /LENGTH=149 /DNA_ID=CAMNT_0002363493 /DNA_START=286 /DNA_END=735 /DNA_ORIENTATION=+